MIFLTGKMCVIIMTYGQIQLPTDTHERLIPRNPTDDCIAPKVQKTSGPSI